MTAIQLFAFVILPLSLAAGGWERRASHGADAPWLDPCDEHREEGAGGAAAAVRSL